MNDNQHAITPENSEKVRNFSLFCSFLVVCIHIPWLRESDYVGRFMSVFVKEWIARIAVPFFFVVSGFFLARHFAETGWWIIEVKKRVKSLLIPFVFWALVDFFIISRIAAQRPFPLWYLRCLFLFVVCGEVFKWGVCKLGLLWLLLVFTPYLALQFVPDAKIAGFSVIGFFTRWISLEGIFYFSVGIFIQMANCHNVSMTLGFICGIIAIFGGAECCGWHIGIPFKLLTRPFLMLFFWRFMPNWRLPGWLSRATFPIFLMHTLFVTMIGHVGGGRCAMLLGGILFPIVFAAALFRYAATVAFWLFGGRG